MTRQTAFPGIIIESIGAHTAGSGRTLDFEEGLPENLPPERIRSFIGQIELFGSGLTDSTLTYTLQVAAYHRSAAQAKARVFVRAKNPFEIDVMEAPQVTKLKDLGVLRGGRNAYRVKIRVTK